MYEHLCILLSLPPGGPGLHDPCEKEPTDTLTDMSNQQAEAITYSAQVHTYNAALRQYCYPPALLALSCHTVGISKQHDYYQTQKPHTHSVLTHSHTIVGARLCIS